MQCSHSVLPYVEVKEPPAQSLHVGCPRSSWNVPAAHRKRSPLRQLLPAVQSRHTAPASREEPYWPSGHVGAHAGAARPLNWPHSQLMHADDALAPSAALNFPGAHAVQLC